VRLVFQEVTQRRRVHIHPCYNSVASNRELCSTVSKDVFLTQARILCTFTLKTEAVCLSETLVCAYNPEHHRQHLQHSRNPNYAISEKFGFLQYNTPRQGCATPGNMLLHAVVSTVIKISRSSGAVSQLLHVACQSCVFVLSCHFAVI
jgi:hypothetical protein